MTTQNPADHERSAAGLDFDFPLREHATNLGQTLGEEGPAALLEEIENILPEPVREQVRSFPLVSLLVGLAVGIFLGIKKGDEVLAAGAALVSAAAMTNVSSALGGGRADA
jgi:hypothetical protein